MKTSSLIALAGAALVAASPSFAQSSKIWRCGNAYTNSEAEAKAKGCKPMEGGNLTIVEGTRVNGNAGVRVAAATPAGGSNQRVESEEQKARDANARAILEAELKKAEARQAELLKEYNNGEPDKVGPEHKNYQKYLDRVAELKANIARNENDINGLKRELSRLPAK